MRLEDMHNAPKLFCENIKLGYSGEFFVMALSSGDESSIFTLTPQHAKRLQQYLAHEVAQYEKHYGHIDAPWNPNVLSPVQRVNPPGEMS